MVNGFCIGDPGIEVVWTISFLKGFRPVYEMVSSWKVFVLAVRL